MRTVELHAHAKPLQRKGGRSSVGAAAYRAAERIHDERMGITHDYTRKRGVEHTQIHAPEHAPEWVQSRAMLWNAAEAKENRSNSCTAYEWEIGFLAEFDQKQRFEAGGQIAHELMRRYGCAVDIAYHEPNTEGDDRNYHAHILFTSRAFDETSKDGWAKAKFRDLSQDKVTLEDGEKTTRGQEEIRNFRGFIADCMNIIAERDGIEARIEHRSFFDRGIDREPELKLGAVATQMEREGKQSERGNELREVWKRNAEHEYLRDDLDAVDIQIANVRLREMESAQAHHGGFKELYDLQRRRMDEERERFEGQIKALSEQLEGRSRLAVFWDKMRGRLGWNAETELNIARMEAEAHEQRRRALELSYAHQQERERGQREIERDAQRENRQKIALSLDKVKNEQKENEIIKLAEEFRQAREGSGMDRDEDIEIDF